MSARAGTEARLLDAQVAAAVAAAWHVLGEDGEHGRAGLRPAIAALVARLEAQAPQLGARAAQDTHEARLARLRQQEAARTEAFERVHEAVRRLREITTPEPMLRAAAAELSTAARLRRVVVSSVRERRMTALTAHVAGDEEQARALLAALRERPVLLEHPLIDAEALRRRRATVVTHAQAHPRADRGMAETMGWDAYLVAPVAVDGGAIAVLHADDGPGAPLDELRRELLWAFACGLAQGCESASLRRTLRRERERTRRLLQWLDARSVALSDAAVELVPRELPQPPLLDTAEPEGRAPGGADDTELARLLTRRELEVLRLLVGGRTNRAIADELVVAPGTVKFHVNSILRKLHVANRAEAVARYYALRSAAARAED